MICKIAYTAYMALFAIPNNSLNDISHISKIHSSELIIFCFLIFLRKKKFATSAKNQLHDKYYYLGSLRVPKQKFVYLFR